MLPRNMTLFRFGKCPCFDIEAALVAHHVREPGSMEMATSGFAPVMQSESGDMTLEAEGCTAFVYARQERVLPCSAVKSAVSKKVRAIKLEQNRRVGSKERRQIKEDVLNKLVPNAPVRERRIRGWIDTRGGWVVFDCSSRKWAEVALSQLREAFGSFSAIPLAPKSDPRRDMTEWLAGWQRPADIQLGDEALLRTIENNDGATAALRGQDLDSEEVKELLHNGKTVEQLGFTFNQRLELVLTASLEVKRVRATDVFACERGESEDIFAQARADLTLAVLEVRRFLEWMSNKFSIERPQEV